MEAPSSHILVSGPCSPKTFVDDFSRSSPCAGGLMVCSFSATVLVGALSGEGSRNSENLSARACLRVHNFSSARSFKREFTPGQSASRFLAYRTPNRAVIDRLNFLAGFASPGTVPLVVT